MGWTDEAYVLTTKLMRKGGNTSQNLELLLLRVKCLFDKEILDDTMWHLHQIILGDPDNKEAFMMLKYLHALGRKKDEVDTSNKSQIFDTAVLLYSDAIELCPMNKASSYRANFFSIVCRQNQI